MPEMKPIQGLGRLIRADSRLFSLIAGYFRVETGSHQPAHTTIQSPQTALSPVDARALLRGFPATCFADFGLCRRSPFFVMIFGALSLHPKIPFPTAGL